MPTRARRTCPRCRSVLTRPGPCPTCRARRDAVAPGTDYRSTSWTETSRAYLADHPTCSLCGAPAKVADHHPISRRQLRRLGVPDPDAPQHLRALCLSCHGKETARHQPGGWNA